MDEGPVLPGYVPFLSLTFKLIATASILLLSSWVVYTIKTTRSLHKPHNIFVANLLVSGMIVATAECLISGTMIVSSVVGVESVIGCYSFKFVLLPFLVNTFSFVLIPADKVLAIRSPFKHRRIMTPHTVRAIIFGAWLFSIIPAAFVLIFPAEGTRDVPEYGACMFDRFAFIEFLIILILPTIVSPLLAIMLNVYLTIKAHQIHKQIDKETTLHGVNSQSERITSLERNLRNLRRHIKPVKTLLVVVLGGALLNLMFVPLFFLVQALIDSHIYHEVMRYIIGPNFAFITHFLDPLVYGLYFKQVRQPMMRCLRGTFRMRKLNKVAPMPTRTTWM